MAVLNIVLLQTESLVARLTVTKRIGEDEMLAIAERVGDSPSARSYTLKDFLHGSDRFTLAERAISIYLLLLPLLWATGLMLPSAILVVFGIFAMSISAGSSLSYALPWFAVGMSQIISVSLNLLVGAESAALLLKHCVSSYVLGWFMLGCALGIGASGQIRPFVMLSNVVWLSRYVLILSIPAYVLALFLPQESLFILSPIGHLIPEHFAARNFSFGMFIYNWEEFDGRLFPRLSVLFPWPTAMGTAGICVVFISACAEAKKERLVGMVGGIVMVIASMGRIAALTLIACSLIRLLMKLKIRTAVVVLGLVVASVSVFVITQQANIDDLAESTLQKVSNTREGASQVRDAVYEASWKGFDAKPWFGNGWPGEPLFDNDQVFQTSGVMVVGSHSTVSGLLYKGGAITFALFVIAFILTAIHVVRRSQFTNQKNTICILLALASTCVGEGLESLVLPLVFAFVWIGIAIAYPKRLQISATCDPVHDLS